MIVGRNMKLTSDGRQGGLEAMAEQAVVAACTLADAADPYQWSASAVEDAASALEVLAGALARLDPESAEILSVVPVAAGALLERVELTRAGAAVREAFNMQGAAVTSTALRQALTARGIPRHRVHQLGAALLTVTLDAADAQALAVLLARRDGLPRQGQGADADWGGGPAETAAAALAEALADHGPGTYARVLSSGQVSAGLTQQSAQNVVTALTARPTTSRRAQRRGLGPGYKGVATQ